MGASDDVASTGGHTPVLYQHVLAALPLRADGHYIDGTVGAAGHAFGILKSTAPSGSLLGLDRDPHALGLAAERLSEFGARASLHQASFAEIEEVAHRLNWQNVDGILLDIGLSSMQLEDGARGFSFRLEGPLDMRFDPTQSLTAEELVNTTSEQALTSIISKYGEEPRARTIARTIIAARPLTSTLQLADVIKRTTKRSKRGIHPATRTFQALRIAVNDELDALERGLEAAVRLLTPGGRIVVITFHSLEDRIVKQFFRQESQDCICPPESLECRCGHKAELRIITKKPIRPEDEEIQSNPRSRSAKMRVAERIKLA
jgi:16S rRNA (cytosine1402-N4)-methyltransferase